MIYKKIPEHIQWNQMHPLSRWTVIPLFLSDIIHWILLLNEKYAEFSLKKSKQPDYSWMFDGMIC